MGFKNIVMVQAVLVAVYLVAFSSGSILRHRFHAEDSCEGRCNQTGTIPGAPCQCNTACERFNDCCSDYAQLCQGQQPESCVGRCDQVGTIPGTCQCNKPCMEFGDCCPDYSDVCAPAEGITDPELEALAEQLLNLDTVNNATAYITVDLQGRSGSGDNAPNPLLTVAPEAFALTTIQKLRALHDNYIADTSKPEDQTPQEEEEIDDFITTIFNTPIMQTAQAFLASKNLPNGREDFYTLWFELFTRGNGVISSSGFEHIFLGELRPSEVSGFHNWEYFYVEEQAERLDYLGYAEYVDMQAKGSIIEHSFNWQGRKKPVTSMFIGASPEFELAIYTVCFHARPNAKCPTSLNGNKVKIQTYTIGSRGQHVGSAYPDLSN